MHEFPYEKVREGVDDFGNLVCKVTNHLSIVKIKERCKVMDNFSFRLATTEGIKAIIRDIPTNEAAYFDELSV